MSRRRADALAARKKPGLFFAISAISNQPPQRNDPQRRNVCKTTRNAVAIIFDQTLIERLFVHVERLVLLLVMMIAWAIVDPYGGWVCGKSTSKQCHTSL